MIIIQSRFPQLPAAGAAAQQPQPMIAFFRKWRRNKNLLRSSSGPCYPYPRSHSTVMVVPSNRPAATTQEEEKKKQIQPRRRPPLNRAIPTIPESKSNESIMSHASRISGAAVAPAPDPATTEADCMVIENKSALERLPPVKRDPMRRPDSVAKEKTTPRSPLLSVAHTMREKLSKLTRRKSPSSGVKASQSFSGFRGAPPPPPPVDENSNRVIKSSSMEASLASDRPSTSKVKIPQLPEPLCADEPSESCDPSSLSENSEAIVKVSMKADVLTVTEVAPLPQPVIPEEIEEPEQEQEIRREVAPSSTTVIVAERPRELPVTIFYKQEQVALVKEKPLQIEENIVKISDPLVEVKKEENKENTQPELQEKKQITTTLIITTKKIEEVKPLPPRAQSPEKSKSPERFVMTVKTPEAQRKHRTFAIGERASEPILAVAPEVEQIQEEPKSEKVEAKSRREGSKSPERYILRVKSPEPQRNHRVFVVGPKSESIDAPEVATEEKKKKEKTSKIKEKKDSREDSKSPERFILTVKTPETLRKHRVLTIKEGPASEGRKSQTTITRSRSCEERATLKIWSNLKKSLALRRTQTFSNSDLAVEPLRSASSERRIEKKKVEEPQPIHKEKFVIVAKTPQALRRHHTFMVGERPRTPDYPWIEEGELTEPIATVGPSAQRAQKIREKRTRSEEPRVERREDAPERFVMTARTPLAMRKYQTFVVEAKKPALPSSASADVVQRRGDELIKELDAIYPATSSRLDSREFSSSMSKEFNPFPQESPRRISTSEMYSLTSTTPQLRRRDEAVASPTLFVLNKRSERPLDERLEAVREASQSDRAEPLRTPSMDDLTSIDDDIPMDTRTDGNKPVVAVLPLTSRPVPGGVSPKAGRKKKKGSRSGGLNQTQRGADHRLLRGLRSAGRIFSPGIFNKKRTPPPTSQLQQHPAASYDSRLAPLAQVESSVVANSPLVEALPIEAWNTPRPRCSPPRAFAALIREEPHDANGNPQPELPSSPQLLHRGLIDDEILDQPMLVGDSFSHSESSDRLSLNQGVMAASINLDHQQSRRADVVPTQHIPPTVRNDNSYIDESLAHVADIKNQLRDLQTFINDHNNETTTMDMAALARENDSLRRQLLERDQLIEQLRQQLANLRPLQTVLGGAVSSISRSIHHPDALLSSTCPAPCEQLFHARPNNSLPFGCGCNCPPEAPVFLHTAGQCVEKLEECQTNVRFFSAEKGTAFIPVAVLPAKNGVLLSKWHLVWNEAGLVESTSHVNCSVTAVFFENASHRWKAASRKMFAIMAVKNRTSIIYKGSEAEALQLTGSVVQLKLSCSGSIDDSICLSFRVDGTSGHPPEELAKIRWEVVLACLCLLLVLALLATFYLGFLCWRLEKRKLIGRIQMQILCDYRRQQEVHTAHLGQLEMGEGGYKPVLLPKRRLLFHAEFLEREYLENPPEDAELFLAQLRRMVDAARERIRMRRFVPMLITIPEMPEAEESEKESPPPSPNSLKSVDSGRDSRSEESYDSSSPKASRPSRLPIPTNIQSMPVIVPLRPPPPSKIPTPVGAASPRALHKSLTIVPKSYKERKGYAVFPVDPMLNKSLPRRAKRSSIPGATPPPIPPKPQFL